MTGPQFPSEMGDSPSLPRRTPASRWGARFVVVATTGMLVAGPLGALSEASAASMPSRCKVGRVVCINKSTNTLRWVVNGSVRLSMSARFGSTRTPTREGTFYIYWKDIDHVSTLFGSAMPFAMFFNGGQAVHYSSDFAARGYAGRSHGCVNTRNWAATRSLYRAAHVGDKVVVYRS